ncbi:5889_t:CDS:1, partial [Ambispora gerdemannii]
GEKTRFDSDEITDRMQVLQPNTLQQLVKNAKKPHAWSVNSRGPVYNGAAQSTLRNKRAYWRKAASGSKKIIEIFQTNKAAEPNTDLTFENTYDSSDDDDNKFTLESLNSLLKKKKDDLRLRM